MSGYWDRNLNMDLEAIRGRGAVAVVTLVEEKQLALLRVTHLREEVHRRAMASFHLPIADGSAPNDDFDRRWELPVTGAAHCCAVDVHCRGGLGRAGTIGARLSLNWVWTPPSRSNKRAPSCRGVWSRICASSPSRQRNDVARSTLPSGLGRQAVIFRQLFEPVSCTQGAAVRPIREPAAMEKDASKTPLDDRNDASGLLRAAPRQSSTQSGLPPLPSTAMKHPAIAFFRRLWPGSPTKVHGIRLGCNDFIPRWGNRLMVQLILVFCLAASGTTCKEVHPIFEDPLTLMGCVTQAQVVAVQELSDRLDLQGYQLARWRCEMGKPLDAQL
jgi:Cyclin-dependent kinase inhibitor 3 (CDKN3)